MTVYNYNKFIYSLISDYSLEASFCEIMDRVNEIEKVYSHIDKHAKLRMKDYHDKSVNDKKRAITDFIVENRYYQKEELNKQGCQLNLLWIENNPSDLKKDMENIHKYFPKYQIWLKDDKLDSLLDELRTKNIQTKNFITDEQKELKVDEIDIVILDLYLNEKPEAKCQGEEVLKYLREKHIGIPVIILSVSEDYEEVARLYSLGADFFVNKKYALQLPLYIHRVFDKYGIILWSLNRNDDYRKKLLKNIRYWIFFRNFLWYGDKCYHMIDHSFNHIYDNWLNTNKIFLIIKNKIKEENWSDSDIYSFCMAMWLHDIGHKGNARYGEAYQIRDIHGLISGELILQQPDLFSITEEDGENFPNKTDKYYEGLTFPVGNQKLSVVQLIRDREILKNMNEEKILSNAEKIALLSIYHKSNAPLTVTDGFKMQSSRKDIPSEYFESHSHSEGRLITLQDILEKRFEKKLVGKEKINEKCDVKRFLQMASLFRFIDGIDLHKTRVGDESEKDLKLKVINQDKEYYFGKLEETVNYLIEKLAKDDSALAMQIYNDLYIKNKDKIINKFYEPDSKYKKFIESKLHSLDNYWMILNYAAFISVQEGHFDLHNCVDEIDLVPQEKNETNIELTYHLNKGIIWLSTKTVLEMRVKEMTILEKLFGKVDVNKLIKLPYPLDELKEGIKYLCNYFSIEEKMNGSISVVLKFPEDDKSKEILSKLNIKFSNDVDTNKIMIRRKFGLLNGEINLFPD